MIEETQDVWVNLGITADGEDYNEGDRKKSYINGEWYDVCASSLPYSSFKKSADRPQNIAESMTNTLLSYNLQASQNKKLLGRLKGPEQYRTFDRHYAGIDFVQLRVNKSDIGVSISSSQDKIIYIIKKKTLIEASQILKISSPWHRRMEYKTQCHKVGNINDTRADAYEGNKTFHLIVDDKDNIYYTIGGKEIVPLSTLPHVEGTYHAKYCKKMVNDSDLFQRGKKDVWVKKIENKAPRAGDGQYFNYEKSVLELECAWRLHADAVRRKLINVDDEKFHFPSEIEYVFDEPQADLQSAPKNIRKFGLFQASSNSISVKEIHSSLKTQLGLLFAEIQSVHLKCGEMEVWCGTLDSRNTFINNIHVKGNEKLDYVILDDLGFRLKNREQINDLFKQCKFVPTAEELDAAYPDFKKENSPCLVM